MNQPFKRPVAGVLEARLREERRFLQVLSGPRQVGKTTLVRQVTEKLAVPTLYGIADSPSAPESAWIQQQWDTARMRAGAAGPGGAILVLDEVQKIAGWSESVKRLWDEDTASAIPLRVVLLGSSPLLVRKGLTESLAGRFELIPMPHWSFTEMHDAFGWSVDQYVHFGGYPGSASLIDDPERWASYIRDSLIETVVARDILLMTRVDKPALLRRLFQLGCEYSAQVLSYQKMTGQLQDAGNTTTLAHYLSLLASAWLVAGLPKFSLQRVRQRAASPKLLVLNTALLSASTSTSSLEKALAQPESWGRQVETAVGAHLINSSAGSDLEVAYWRERKYEVDFVLRIGKTVVPIEVKSSRKRLALPGLEEFAQRFRIKRRLTVGAQGIPLEEFLRTPARAWID